MTHSSVSGSRRGTSGHRCTTSGACTLHGRLPGHGKSLAGAMRGKSGSCCQLVVWAFAAGSQGEDHVFHPSADSRSAVNLLLDSALQMSGGRIARSRDRRPVGRGLRDAADGRGDHAEEAAILFKLAGSPPCLMETHRSHYLFRVPCKSFATWLDRRSVSAEIAAMPHSPHLYLAAQSRMWTWVKALYSDREAGQLVLALSPEHCGCKVSGLERCRRPPTSPLELFPLPDNSALQDAFVGKPWQV